MDSERKGEAVDFFVVGLFGTRPSRARISFPRRSILAG